ncbi:EF-hand 1, calcium-binding site protein [Rhizoctonia solani]|uniref:EF-hand 1, calcium-binding site protein n=1 Tax=Rhizoctonia solani TaxID=456999 RepID=A0A8H8P7I6_9AGAM|nr:EF-hand 1, calcium-binding site protein [Rhizoctonia solani]QRW26974.1 EF-hand 1, calcium-binding site protein [Rhizoctonia solani]
MADLLDDDGAVSQKVLYDGPGADILQILYAEASATYVSTTVDLPRGKRVDGGVWAGRLGPGYEWRSFPDETKEEMKDTLDVDDQGNLTFNGFIQIYQLQTENDEEETWRDLSAHGFDRNLILVSTRRETDHKADTSGIFTPTARAETPEPNTQSGRRNAGKSVQLLDSSGTVSKKFEAALAHIFHKYSKPTSAKSSSTTIDMSHSVSKIDLNKTPTKIRPQLPSQTSGVLTEAGLDAWARDTMGHSWSADTKEEFKSTLDVNERGELTFRGFVQIYQLQAESDEAETWRDLSAHGFDRDLNLVSTRREDVETPVPTPQVLIWIRASDCGFGGRLALAPMEGILQALINN